ncbi:MAG TPA: hypothetical protein VIE36_13140 [Methylomirabilota bacterium]|jgi:hypothetical protein
MSYSIVWRWFAVLGLVIVAHGAAAAQTFSSGSTGADGAFAPTTSVQLPIPNDGVFNFTTINIPAGVTVSFATSAGVRRPPISFLATGNVVVAGRIDVSGGNGGAGSGGAQLFSNAGVGGPGGFDGGAGSNGLHSSSGGAGLGPGGGLPGSSTAFPGHAGHLVAAGGVSGGRAYGEARLVPLVGGSGGGGGASQQGATGSGGGGGGGALLLASSGTMTVSGTLAANGGAGGPSTGPPGGSGSGGAIRLVATTLLGNPTIDVNGGPGASPGRIRVEAFTNAATVNGAATGALTVGTPDALAFNVVGLRIAAIGGVSAPAAPVGSYGTPDIVLPAGTTSPVTVTLEAREIPLGTTITVAATPLSGAPVLATSTPLIGTPAAATATATLAIPTMQPSVLSATAVFTLSGAP